MTNIRDYKAFLIQKGVDPVKDSYTEWGMIVKSVPFKPIPDPKEIYSEDWPDEDGEDEYIPSIMHYKAYEMDVSFFYIGDSNTANASIISFFNYIKNGLFKIYDTYTGIGRQNVRYAGYKENAFLRRDEIGDIVEFTVTFKVNDPVTQIELTKS